MPDSTCVVVNCDRAVKVKSRGLCNAHYQRFMKHGTTDARPKPVYGPCKVDNCDRIEAKRGLCGTHYSRLRRKGTPDTGPVRIWASAEERFWPLVTKTETCWLFSSLAPNGYGYFCWNGVPGQAHRYAYEKMVGPIPEGLTIDHLCKTRACVNPDHLEAVTQRENTLRSDATSALNARKTECLRGHPFSVENTYFDKDGHRHCRACGRERNAQYYREKVSRSQIA